MNIQKRTLTISLVGIMAALMAVGAWIAIPMPWGVSFTLQTLMMALAGYLLGPGLAPLAVVIYILLGLVGLPVFTGFNSGPGVLSGPTGGYIWGFIPMAFFCGLAALPKEPENAVLPKKVSRILARFLLSAAGLACCHIPGVLQLAKVAGMSCGKAFAVGSLSYLAKDIVSMVIAWGISVPLRQITEKFGGAASGKA